MYNKNFNKCLDSDFENILGSTIVISDCNINQIAKPCLWMLVIVF